MVNIVQLRNQHLKQSVRIVENLARLMKAHQISEADLSRQTGIPQATLNKLLQGLTEDPRISTLIALAKHFNISLDLLVGVNSHDGASPVSQFVSIPILEWEHLKQWKSKKMNINPYTHKSWIVSERSSPDTFALRTLPFMEPLFQKGSVILVEPQLEYKDGCYLVIDINDKPTVRRLIHEENAAHLRSLDPSLPTIPLDPSYYTYGAIIETRFKQLSE